MFRYLLIYFLSGLFYLEATQPLALYLTWQQDPTQTMTIVWLTPLNEVSSELQFRLDNDPSHWITVQGSSKPFPYNYPCRIHQATLTQLSPNSRYRFRLEPEGSEHAFCTLPNTLQEPLTFIEGGDCYHDKLASLEEMNRMAAAHNPAFVILGGDLAYAAGKGKSSKDHIPRWIEFLQAWTKTMVTSDGRLIPLLVAIGNHDVNGRDNQTAEQALVFHHLFPLPEGKTNYQLMIGDYLSLIALDTGHTQPIVQQAEWLNEALSRTPSSAYRFVFYHVPAYPSVRSFNNSTSRTIRSAWVPIFDRHLVDLVFEHHDHAYKRTHPLVNNRMQIDGVLYVGDGAWGAKPRSTKRAWYLIKTAVSRNCLVVSLLPKAVQIKAVTPQGQILDTFERLRRQR